MNMKMNNPQNQNWLNKIRHQFLLTFFEGNCYAEKNINGFYLVKQFNAKSLNWEVAIYSKEAFQKRQAHKERLSKLFVPRGNKQERG